MKILHITATHLKKYGGIPVVLENLVKNQNRINDVTSMVLSVKYNVDEIKSDYFVFKKGMDEIKRFINEYNPDTIIFHGIYFIEYVTISKIIDKMNIKYYIEPHGSFMKVAQKKGAFKKMLVNKLLLNNFFSNAYGYIFLNDNEKKESIFSTKNDLIIPNGIEIKKEKIEKKVNKKINIVFIGRIDINHKGIDRLMEALKKIDDIERMFKVSIYGVGGKKEIKTLNKYINKFNNLEVEFRGAIYDKEKVKVLIESNIMILTSRYEGFPMSIIEALYYGNPCIVTSGTNVREIIDNNNLGWGSDDNCIEEIILKAVKEYNEKSDYYITHTQKFIRENYKWEKIAEESIKFLKG